MATVTKTIADDVIAGKYDEDNIVKIVKYNNCFDGKECYGIITASEDTNRYSESEFVLNPVTYWEKK